MRPSFCGSPPSPAPENWCDSGDGCTCGGCARPDDALDGTSDGCAGPGDALDGTTGDGCAGPGDVFDVHTGDGCANSGDALDGTGDGCDGTGDILDGTGDVLDGNGDVLDGNGDVIDVNGDGCAGLGDVLDGTGAGSCHTSPSSGGICASDKLGPGDGVSLPHAAGSNPAKAFRGCSQVTSRVYDRRPDTSNTLQRSLGWLLPLFKKKQTCAFGSDFSARFTRSKPGLRNGSSRGNGALPYSFW